jgi:hypothetical protein
MTHSYRTFVRSGVSTKPGQVHALQGGTYAGLRDNAPDPAKARPAAFEALRGSGYVLITFTRALR